MSMRESQMEFRLIHKEISIVPVVTVFRCVIFLIEA